MAFATSNCQKHQYNSVTKIENLALKPWLKDFNGILWGQQLIVDSDRHNLTQDTTLGIIELASVLLKIDNEEIGPVIVYTKERIIILWQILISQYNFTPLLPRSQKRKAVKFEDIHKCWCDVEYVTHTKSNKQHLESMNYVFANRSKKDEETFPLTILKRLQNNSTTTSLYVRSLKLIKCFYLKTQT